MKKRRGYKRTERVGKQLHEFLASTLLIDLEDPNLAGVQVTHVEVSPDLRHARVLYVLLGSDEPDEEAQLALERATRRLKREIGAQLRMKYIPDLAFEYDESVQRGRRIEDLLSGLRDD
ncbi:MAG: 30S ribosome-binding factor RbfA [Bradymonadaceae bacterium]